MSTLVQPAPQKLKTPTLPKGDDCLVVIFGGTGDLTHRKLIPALYDLACVGCTTRNFQVLGIGRTKLDDAAFSARLHDGAAQSKDTRNFTEEGWKDFAERLHYLVGDAGKREFYPELKKKIVELQKNGASKNVLFYISTSASLAPPIVEGLGEAGLAKNSEGWTRIILEKPFGSDLESARELNEMVAKVFDESSVYRIDHYLGKETVQNLLAFRFGNGFFEPLWNNNYIDHVQITVAETVGVEHRGSFYEVTGALRDMVPNHILALVSLTAMEPPNSFDSEPLRDEKTKVLRAIRPFTAEDIANCAVRGQYGAGTLEGKSVPGYRTEPNVDPKSGTETYVALQLAIDNWRWAGVPFYLRTGKRMAERVTEIAIRFKAPPALLFRQTGVKELEQNELVMHIQPNEGISLSFSAKIPGPVVKLGGVDMNFTYKDYFRSAPSIGYETLLLDCMIGDPTLFQRADTVDAGWRVVDPILDAWKAKPGDFPNYAAGSWGPQAADNLLARDGRQWRLPQK